MARPSRWGILLGGGLLMAIACTATVTLAYSGDRSQTYTFPGVSNPVSPDAEQLVGLIAGDNTIPIPTSGVVAQGATIIPPPTNTAVIILKGNAGDTGVMLNRRTPTMLGLDSGVLSVILNASAPVAGVRVRVY